MIGVSELRFALEKAGCFISDLDMQEILDEFQLTLGSVMNYADFKNIMGCFSNISSEFNTETDEALRRGQKRLSQRRITMRRASMREITRSVIVALSSPVHTQH